MAISVFRGTNVCGCKVYEGCGKITIDHDENCYHSKYRRLYKENQILHEKIAALQERLAYVAEEMTFYHLKLHLGHRRIPAVCLHPLCAAIKGALAQGREEKP